MLTKGSIKRLVRAKTDTKFNDYSVCYLGVLINEYIEPIILTAVEIHDKRNSRRDGQIPIKKLITEDEVREAYNRVYGKDNNV